MLSIVVTAIIKPYLIENVNVENILNSIKTCNLLMLWPLEVIKNVFFLSKNESTCYTSTKTIIDRRHQYLISFILKVWNLYRMLRMPSGSRQTSCLQSVINLSLGSPRINSFSSLSMGLELGDSAFKSLTLPELPSHAASNSCFGPLFLRGKLNLNCLNTRILNLLSTASPFNLSKKLLFYSLQQVRTKIPRV